MSALISFVPNSLIAFVPEIACGYPSFVFNKDRGPAMRVHRVVQVQELLLFAVCVILAVHELLAADGWLRLPG